MPSHVRVIRREGRSARPAVFLDRDGTINAAAARGDYITSPTQLRLLHGAARGIRAFNLLKVPVIVVTNQRGVARDRMTLDDLAAVTDRLNRMLAQHGARIDATYTCTHEEGTCLCRKPAPGLILQACRDRPEIDLGSSTMIGDTESDVLAGRAAGVLTVRLAPSGTPTAADMLCPDLAEASRVVAQRVLSRHDPAPR